MSEAKPTPGPCWVDVHHNVKSARGMIAFPCLSSGCDQETVAHMIAQTFNVHYTTGMTPVQFVEQRDELVERVKELEAVVRALIAYDESDHEDGVQMMLDYADMLKGAYAALSKARPNTAEGAGPLASDDEMFEFWWADHAPNSTQEEAWAEWCALRSDKQEPSP